MENIRKNSLITMGRDMIPNQITMIKQMVFLYI